MHVVDVSLCRPQIDLIKHAFMFSPHSVTLSDGVQLEKLKDGNNVFISGHFDSQNIAWSSLTLLLPYTALSPGVTYECLIGYMRKDGGVGDIHQQINITSEGLFFQISARRGYKANFLFG